MTLMAELESFLNQHLDIEQFDVLLADLNGVLRGKRLPRSAMKKLYTDGLLLPRSLFASDIEGDTVDETMLGIKSGDIDCTVWPIAGSLKVVPWADTPSAQVLGTMVDADGNTLTYTPRAVLSNTIEKFSTLGLTPIVAPELEFFLLDKNNDDHGRPQPPVSPVTGQREQATQVYGIAELDDYGEFLQKVKDAAALQKIPTDTAIAEYGPGQFEINLYHSDDPLRACDHAIELKRLVKAVANKCGFQATFMPKPFFELSGNGFHMHISLYREGVNVFSNGEELGNDTLRYAIGGLGKLMNESMLIAAPGANSYRRFSPECYTPLQTSWGFNNRSVAMRIPAGPEQAKRVECRVAGADANPYLYLAALLSGIHYGITEQIEPGPVTKINAYDEFEPSLPLNWEASIFTFSNAEILPHYFGKDFCRIYLNIKQAEQKKFHEQITPLEYLWYKRHS